MKYERFPEHMDNVKAPAFSRANGMEDRRSEQGIVCNLQRVNWEWERCEGFLRVNEMNPDSALDSSRGTRDMRRCVIYEGGEERIEYEMKRAHAYSLSETLSELEIN